MDKKSKIFFIIFGLLIAGSVAVTYWRIMIKKDYIIEAQADCDPTVEQCFVWECDPESDVEGEKCTGNADEDIWYYEIVRRNASRIPLCDPADENCEALVCGENELECEYIFCTEENKEEQGVECNDPVAYALENPTVEEDVSCVDGEVCPVEEDLSTEATTTEENVTCAADDDTCAVSLPETVEATTSDEMATTTEVIN